MELTNRFVISALGLVTAFLINSLIPPLPPPRIASRTHAVLAGVIAENENTARRERVVDGGAIIEEEEREDVFTPTSDISRKVKGKRKAE